MSSLMQKGEFQIVAFYLLKRSLITHRHCEARSNPLHNQVDTLQGIVSISFAMIAITNVSLMRQFEMHKSKIWLSALFKYFYRKLIHLLWMTCI